MFERPTLVAFMGPVATGKTSLGEEVAKLLRVPFFDHERDFRVPYFGEFHPIPATPKKEWDDFMIAQGAAYDIMFDVVRGKLKQGISFVVAATFVSGFSQSNLVKAVADVPGAELQRILCWTRNDSDDVVEARLKARALGNKYAGAANTLEVYREQKARWLDPATGKRKPLTGPYLEIDTFPPHTVAECARQVIAYLETLR